MTIYSELLKRGYTEEEICGAAQPHYDTRCFGLSVQVTPDGWPIVGVTYQCDFRYEEEAGVGAMAKNIDGATDQVDKIKDLPEGAFIFLAEGKYYEEDYEIGQGRVYWNQAVGWAQGAQALNTYRMSVAEMKQWAKDHNLSLKGKTRRDQIEPLVRKKSVDLAEKKTPNQWPGYFHNGSVLYLKADGIVQETLKLIFMAAGYNAVGVMGGSNSNPFGRGFGFYDKRDIGPKLRAEIDEANRFYKEAMEALEPVQKALEGKGHRFLYLGKPSQGEDGETRYWLNGNTSPLTHNKQPYGWYTLKELQTEKFVEDVLKK